LELASEKGINSVAELAAKSLYTLCDAFVSTSSPIHPEILTNDVGSSPEKSLDSIYEALIWEVSSKSILVGDNEYSSAIHNLQNGMKLSRTLKDMPSERKWRKSVAEASSVSSFALLANWLYAEAVSRFVSAIVVANNSDSRVLQLQR